MAFMLRVLDKALAGMLQDHATALTDVERLAYFLRIGAIEFTRAGYRNVFKDISPATASRDLKKGLELGLFTKGGELNRTVYRVRKR